MPHSQDHDQLLRAQLKAAIEGQQAHIDFDSALKGISFQRAGLKPAGAPHSAWELLEHMRIAQRDILAFSTANSYKELKWPDDYWPKTAAPENEPAWSASLDAFRQDRAQFLKLLDRSDNDLYQALAHGDGQTLLREALLIASHNSYHLGQIVYLRRMLEGA